MTTPTTPASSPATPAPATQVRHPWRATVRTLAAATIGALSLAPEIATAAHISAWPAVAQGLAVTTAITRVLASPGVEAWLARYVPWLAASPATPDA